MILVIDNYDSFTYNLVDILRQKTSVEVVRNDQTTLSAIRSHPPQGILISPGPGRPSDSGVSQGVVYTFAGKIPILGVCLGHQLIGEWLGAQLIHADRPMHGHTSIITHDQQGVFRGLPMELKVMRYHSLVLDPLTFPPTLEATAYTTKGDIMGLRHKQWALTGVQFHPESILSQGGTQMLHNWLADINVI